MPQPLEVWGARQKEVSFGSGPEAQLEPFEARSACFRWLLSIRLPRVRSDEVLTCGVLS